MKSNKDYSLKTVFLHLDSKAAPSVWDLYFDAYCKSMLINLKGQVRSGLDRDSIPNWPQQMQKNICSLCVTQSCPLGAPHSPQEPGNDSKSRAASAVTMLTGHCNSLSQSSGNWWMKYFDFQQEQIRLQIHCSMPLLNIIIISTKLKLIIKKNKQKVLFCFSFCLQFKFKL